MLVKFILRKPGDHHQIAKGKMDVVPRQGELVIINDVSRPVHSVEWNVTEMSVKVFLDPLTQDR
jgi:hypothetical protein